MITRITRKIAALTFALSVLAGSQLALAVDNLEAIVQEIEEELAQPKYTPEGRLGNMMLLVEAVQEYLDELPGISNDDTSALNKVRTNIDHYIRKNVLTLSVSKLNTYRAKIEELNTQLKDLEEAKLGFETKQRAVRNAL
jgi:hypothetical protein